MKITEEMLKDIKAELIRRFRIDVRDNEIHSEREAREMWAAMLQGSYGTLMAIAINWSDAVSMMDRIGFDELSYDERW